MAEVTMIVSAVRQWGTVVSGAAGQMNGAYSDILDLRVGLGPYARAAGALSAFGGSWGSVLADLQNAVQQSGGKLTSSANAVGAADSQSRLQLPGSIPNLTPPTVNGGDPNRKVTVDVPHFDPNVVPQGTYGPYLPGHQPANTFDELTGRAPTWANGGA